MSTLSNAVFISYHRDIAAAWAMLICADLKTNGIDAFYDLGSLYMYPSDDLVFNQIAARPYFAPILTPRTIVRCGDDGDWVRGQIEEAVRTGRKIVPLYTPSFTLKDLDKYLPPDIARELRRWKGVRLHRKTFEASLTEIRTKYLLPVVMELKQISPKEQVGVSFIQKIAGAEERIAARAYYRRGLRRKALDLDWKIAAYTRAIHLGPNFYQPYLTRGLAYAGKGQYDDAIRDYDEAIRLNSHVNAAYHNRAVAYAKKGQYDDAMRDFDHVIRLSPRSADGYYNRGTAYKNKGDYDAAIPDYDQAVLLDPKCARCYNNRGSSYLNKGDYDAAIRDYSQAILLDPDNGNYYGNRGEARNKQGDPEGAASDYRRCLELSPDHPDKTELEEHIRKHG